MGKAQDQNAHHIRHHIIAVHHFRKLCHQFIRVSLDHLIGHQCSRLLLRSGCLPACFDDSSTSGGSEAHTKFIMSTNNLNYSGKRKIALNECKKVYIQRDYNQALVVRFSTEFPEELDNYIDRQIWLDFINDLNQIYAEAEKLSGRAYLENFLGLLTCHLSRLCFKSLWKQKLEEAQALIDDTNQQSFVKNGLYITNPLEKGFRVVEIVMLEEPIQVSLDKNEKNNAPAVVLQPR